MVTALAWAQERLAPPHDNRIAAVLRCGNKGCTSVIKKPMNTLSTSPEWTRKLFERDGWKVDQHNQSLCRCPNCIKVRKTIDNPIKADGLPEDITPLLKKREEPPVNIALIAPPKTVEIGTIPATVKTKIRQKLDAVFDDSAGAYLNGASDRSIAEELGIPMAQVFSYREMAYGPIKRDPELDEIISGIAALRKAHASIQSEIDRLDLKAAAMVKRLGL